MTTKKPINSVDDIKGLKIRTMGVPAHVSSFNAFGAKATPMAYGELYGALQQNVVDGVLQKPQAGDGNTSDWMLSAVELFKAGKYKEARGMIVSQARPEEYEEVYKFMYRNLNLWGDTEQKQDQAIVIIRNGIAKSVAVADPEINLAATLVELEMNSL